MYLMQAGLVRFCQRLSSFIVVSGLVAYGGLASAAGTNEVRTGQTAFGDWTSDAPGVLRHIVVADLPKPNDTPSAGNNPKMVARPDKAWPIAPPGFKVDLLAKGLDNARKIVTAPNGDLFIAESEQGRIKIFRQRGDGTIAKTNIFTEHLHQPFGIAFYPPGKDSKFVYIANTDCVIRYAYKNGQLAADGPAEMIVPDIPGGGRLRGGGHWTRDVVFSKDGKKMFVSVGSHSNVNDDQYEKHRANILEYNPDGSDFRIFASGIRNAVGLAIEPVTGKLWCSVNERDEIGDNLPPDYITHVEDGGFYGWPWYYIGDHQDPRHSGEHPELAEKVIVPDVLLQAHSASLCLTFYTAKEFPEHYRGMAFAAEHGSWNRAKRTGYKIICVLLDHGKATGEYEDFLTGFVTESGDVWGRPVGVTVDSQGSLLITDDSSHSLWRVRYVGGK